MSVPVWGKGKRETAIMFVQLGWDILCVDAVVHSGDTISWCCSISTLAPDTKEWRWIIVLGWSMLTRRRIEGSKYLPFKQKNKKLVRMHKYRIFEQTNKD